MQNVFDMLVISPYDCALMFERVLPETVKPFKLARQNVRLVGLMPLNAFENIASGTDLSGDSAMVQVDVRFETGPGGVALISGRVSAHIPFQCQRCLDPVSVDVAADVLLAVYEEEVDEDALPEGCEPVKVEGEQVRLADLLEQELILALPIVPTHEHCEWVAVPEPLEIIEEPAEVLPQKESPFAGLSELLAKGKSPGNK
jgi:uncharacterized protein